MDDDLVRIDREGDLAVLTLNRPGARNAVNGASGDRHLQRHGRRAGCGAVIVLTGADPAFCAGLDLRDLGLDHLERELAPFVASVANSAVPVIAAVNGPAVTGGFEVALACDFMVASERAAFADTHLRVGVYPGPVAVDLPRRIGMAKARELSLTGNFVDARTALRLGLVNHLVPHDDLLPTAIDLARAVAEQDRSMVAALRRDWDETGGLPLAEARRVHIEHASRASSGARADDLASHREAVLERSKTQRQSYSAPRRSGREKRHRECRKASPRTASSVGGGCGALGSAGAGIRPPPPSRPTSSMNVWYIDFSQALLSWVLMLPIGMVRSAWAMAPPGAKAAGPLFGGASVASLCAHSWAVASSSSGGTTRLTRGRLRGRDRLTEQRHLLGPDEADRPSEQPGPAALERQPAPHEDLPEGGLLAGEHEVASERQLAPPAGGDAVHGGDEGLRALPDAVDHAIPAVEDPVLTATVGSAALLGDLDGATLLGQIGARRERPAVAGDDRDTHRRVLRDLLDGLDDGRAQRPVDGVALLGSVQAEPGHTLVGDRVLQAPFGERRHQICHADAPLPASASGQ